MLIISNKFEKWDDLQLMFKSMFLLDHFFLDLLGLKTQGINFAVTLFNSTYISEK